MAALQRRMRDAGVHHGHTAFAMPRPWLDGVARIVGDGVVDE